MTPDRHNAPQPQPRLSKRLPEIKGTNLTPQTGILTLNELVSKMANLSELRAAAGAAGGKHPASDRQKQIACKTIQRVKP